VEPDDGETVALDRAVASTGLTTIGERVNAFDLHAQPIEPPGFDIGYSGSKGGSRRILLRVG
jgi:hypothetical protein